MFAALQRRERRRAHLNAAIVSAPQKVIRVGSACVRACGSAWPLPACQGIYNQKNDLENENDRTHDEA